MSKRSISKVSSKDIHSGNGRVIHLYPYTLIGVATPDFDFSGHGWCGSTLEEAVRNAKGQIADFARIRNAAPFTIDIHPEKVYTSASEIWRRSPVPGERREVTLEHA